EGNAAKSRGFLKLPFTYMDRDLATADSSLALIELFAPGSQLGISPRKRRSCGTQLRFRLVRRSGLALQRLKTRLAGLRVVEKGDQVAHRLEGGGRIVRCVAHAALPCARICATVTASGGWSPASVHLRGSARIACLASVTCMRTKRGGVPSGQNGSRWSCTCGPWSHISTMSPASSLWGGTWLTRQIPSSAHAPTRAPGRERRQLARAPQQQPHARPASLRRSANQDPSAATPPRR